MPQSLEKRIKEIEARLKIIEQQKEELLAELRLLKTYYWKIPSRESSPESRASGDSTLWRLLPGDLRPQ